MAEHCIHKGPSPTAEGQGGSSGPDGVRALVQVAQVIGLEGVVEVLILMQVMNYCSVFEGDCT